MTSRAAAHARSRIRLHHQPLTKVFGIGLHKTSTSSLACALYTLGYDVAGYFDPSELGSGQVLTDHVMRVAAEYDAVQDMPWPLFFRELDEQFPGSKFVLTTRDPDRWVSSVVRHFGRKRIASHE